MKKLSKSDLSQSRLFLILMAVISGLAPFSMDAYLPALNAISDNLNTSIATANLTISAFLIGNAIGQFIGGALSDSVGRRHVVLFGLVTYILATTGVVFCESILQLFVLRTIQALGCGFASVVTLAQIRDVYPADRVSKAVANIMFIVLLAPLFAPIVGTTLLIISWRAIFAFMAISAVIMIIAYGILIPNTMNHATHKPEIKRMLRGYKVAFLHKVNGYYLPMCLLFFISASMAVFMTFLTNSSSVYINGFGLSSFQFAIAFGCHGMSMIIGNRIAHHFMEKYQALPVISKANWLIIILLTILFVVSLLIEVSLPVVLVMLLLINTAAAVITPTVIGWYISLYEENIGSASSLSTTMMYISGALIGGLVSILSHGELPGVVLGMLFCALVARTLLLKINKIIEQSSL